MRRQLNVKWLTGIGAMAGCLAVLTTSTLAGNGGLSVARQWNEKNLEAIRNDYARPTVHARNLFHVSLAMYDAWAAYDEVADGWLVDEHATATNVQAAREEAISYAAYRVLKARYASSPGAADSLASFDALMDALQYDKDYKGTIGDSPAALGNRIAIHVLAFGLNDGANEAGGFENLVYEPINDPLVPPLPGNPEMTDPNRWQPLALKFFEDQSGNIIPYGYPEALSPEWGIVTPFSLTGDDLTIYPDPDPDFDWYVYHDPGAPPHLGGTDEAYYKWGFEMVSIWSSHLDPGTPGPDQVLWDISPGGIGNAPLPAVDGWAPYYDLLDGGDWGDGYDVNPVTGKPYEPQLVPRGDYTRILAEYWADGPDSETPPGHWFTIMNYVVDHPLFERRFEGEGPIVDALEWDVKAYLALGGAMHDIAISSWGIKGYYDYLRPISAIRYMCDRGQCTDPDGPAYHADGINLRPGLIEVVTEKSRAAHHAAIPGLDDDVIGKIAVYAWRGPDYIVDPAVDAAGVGWILAENWWPYQRPSFVTPPFPGYISGHSTYSRGAAELLTLMTGSPYFPGGLGEFLCPQNEFLVFEEGPSVNCTLQWATYRDASDQTSLSRIWGGIHPPADDIPGRLIGQVIGPEAFDHAKLYFGGRISCPSDLTADGQVGVDDLLAVILLWGSDDQDGDVNLDGIVDVQDLTDLLLTWGVCAK
jgi:hypothetical protein